MKPNTVRMTTIGGVNFFSVFNPVFLCTLLGYFIAGNHPVFERHIYNIFVVAGVYVLPLLFTSAFVQYVTSAFAVRNVLVFTKIGEAFVTVFTAICLITHSVTGDFIALAGIMLLGAAFSFYRPSLKIYISEMLPRSELSRAAAATECSTFAAIFTGVISAVLCARFNPWPGWETLLIVLFSLISVSWTTHFPTNKAMYENVHVKDLQTHWLDSFRTHKRFRELLLTGIGESYVFAAIILIASLAIQYIAGHFTGDFAGEFNLYFIIGSPIIGAGVGCAAAGRRSKGNVEIGLVPGAVLIMIAAALVLGTLPLYADDMLESLLMALCLFFFGFGAGITLVPMQAYQEYFVKRQLAPAFFSWFYLPFGLGIMLAIGLSFVICFFDLPIFTTAAVLAVLTLMLALVTFFFMPQFLLRLIMRILRRVIYRLRIYNAERIPEEGPALLVCNRASFVDIFFISACTSRPIRFMMHESYYDVPLLKYLYKSVGFIRVSPRPKQLKKLFAETADLLRAGELVCIFPEGDITRNGTMSAFSDGFSQMMPQDIEVPLIPLRIGMTWGSIFSCYYGKFSLRWPNELPHPASVTVGEWLPGNISGYELRIKLSELAAETELIPEVGERPFHAQFAFLAKKYPFRRRISQFCGNDKWERPADMKLLIRSALVSRALRAVCSNEEEYIGIMLPNSLDFFVALQGVLMADRKAAMINYTAGQESFEHSLRIGNIRHIITSRAFLQKINRSQSPGMVYIEDIVQDNLSAAARLFWSFAACILPAGELIKQLAPKSWYDVNSTAVLIFSSGSTGIPKGIMLSHHNIQADVTAIVSTLGWSRKDSILGNLPYFHSFGLTVCLWLPVTTGAKVTMIASPLDGAMALQALREDRLSVLVATPGFLQIYMRKGKKEDFASVRVVITGAEKLRDDVAEKFKTLSGLAIAEGYGCTELSPVVTINIANSRLELGIEVAERGSIGPALEGICIKIVDPSTFELLPENTDGLLIVKGAVVMQGYLGEPEKTAEVIRDGWYITGDIARMNRNGFITVTGRISRFSKIAGEMVPHELVERELNNIICPDERVLAVCGAPDSAKGEKLLVFYTDPGRVAPDSLVRTMREKGIPNLWIPKSENFILTDALPLLGSGKLDLASLRKKAEKYAS